MKKCLTGIALFSLLILGGCSNGEAEKQVTEQSKTIESMQKQTTENSVTIESLEAHIADLEKEQGGMAKVETGEKVTLSGRVVVGEDLEPGAYDITLPGEEDVAFSLFDDEQAEKDMKYKHEWLFPKDEDKETADELKSYSLRKGNILDINGNMDFTKVR